jgi:lipopolysaccharide/colanic/teichoic acid biosynthesis glycosyltransferase
MRRLADFVIACLLLAITSPLMLIVALAIKPESRGPFLNTYRTMCITPRPEFRSLLEKIRELRLAA